MPLPGFYTKDVFNEIVGSGTAGLIQQFSAEDWVWGSSAPALASSAGLTTELLNVYEKDYIAFWDGIVHDIEPVPLGSLQNTKQALAILSGPASPLRGLLKAIDKHTYLVGPKDPAAAPGVKERIVDVFKGAAGRVGVPVAPTTAPGAKVTAYFADIHKLVSGDAGAAPIDGILRTLGQIQEKMAPIGDAVGEKAPDPGSMREITELTNTLKRDAAPLPSSVAAVVANIADGTRTAVVGNSGATVTNSYQQRVLNECRELANGRYPFVASSMNDIPLADFERLFGPNGVFDSYFKSDLEAFVNTTRSPWTWRQGAAGGGVPLAQFEAVERIREMFFRGSKPEVRFGVTADGLDRESTRFTLEIDGQEVRNRHDPPRRWDMVWPGPKPAMAQSTFEPAGGLNLSFQGPWAMFRLIDSGQLTRESDTTYLLTLERGTRRIQLRFEADSVRNPFGKMDMLQRFRCE
jgi:type VI secretion system protein ImpL